MEGTATDATAQHVRRTLRALELLVEGPQTQADLARHLEVHRRTARRLLARLVDEGYAQENVGDRHVTYSATARLVILGREVADGLDLMEIGKRHLRLIESCDLHSRYIAIRGAGGVWLPHLETFGSTGTREESVRNEWPLHATAAGKVFLSGDAGLVEDLFHQELIAFTPQTLTSRGDLLLDLADIRAQDYAIEDREFAAENRGAASGVRDHIGRTVAALGVSILPDEDLDLETLGKRVKLAADAFSVEIGGEGTGGHKEVHSEGEAHTLIP